MEIDLPVETTAANDCPPEESTVPASRAVMLATACGLIGANIYYAQPLIGPIASSLGLAPAAAGLIVTMTQIGYGAGLLMIMPLADLIENRRLALVLIGIAALALLGAAMSTHALPFLAAALVIGGGSVAVQVLVVYAAHSAPEATRGRVVGNVMSGLMLGVMLARPVASFIAELSSWHVVFLFSASVMILLALSLRWTLPRRLPSTRLQYGALLASMSHLARTTPVLQRRALYQACLFGAFSLFWTTTPLLLGGPFFHLSQGGIALFGLAGSAGALAAPVAGRLADSGWTKPATGIAMLAVAFAFLMTHVGHPDSTFALGILVAAAILLDAGVTMNMVLSQRAIFALGAEYRGRLNGLFMATFFKGGAIGSAIGGWAFARGGWMLASWLGFALPIIALAFYATELGWPGSGDRQERLQTKGAAT